MEAKQSRRRFLNHCLQFGGACCALLAWNRNLPAQESPEKKQDQAQKPIDFSKLSCCGVPCAQVCELYKATLENDEKLKKLIYEKWEWKKKFGIDYDPEKVFCYTCKPGTSPKKSAWTCVSSAAASWPTAWNRAFNARTWPPVTKSTGKIGRRSTNSIKKTRRATWPNPGRPFGKSRPDSDVSDHRSVT
jgi:hypothetical protein